MRRASFVNLAAIALLLAASIWIQRMGAAAQQIQQLALLAESQRGLVSRVAAELSVLRSESGDLLVEYDLDWTSLPEETLEVAP